MVACAIAIFGSDARLGEIVVQCGAAPHLEHMLPGFESGHVRDPPPECRLSASGDEPTYDQVVEPGRDRRDDPARRVVRLGWLSWCLR